MRVRATEADGRLYLHLRPLKTWAYWLFGLTFVVMGVGTVLLLGRATRFACADGQCELGRVLVLGWKIDRFPAADLRGARVDTVITAGVAHMDLVLETTRGDRPLALPGADGAAKLRHVEAVTAFVRAPAAGRLDIADDARWIGIPLGVLVLAGGAFILFAIETVLVVVDRAAGTLRILSRRVRGGGTLEVPLAEIEDIATPDWTVQGTQSFAVVLLLTGGREQPLTRTPLFTASSAAAVADRLRSAIG